MSLQAPICTFVRQLGCIPASSDVAWAKIFKLSHGLTSDRNLLRLGFSGANAGGIATTLSGKGLQMLKGFTVPRSPLGTAALTPPPPWHYAGNVLAVEFWIDPDVSADILPRGVKLDSRARDALSRSSPIASSPRTATSILIPRAISAANSSCSSMQRGRGHE